MYYQNLQFSPACSNCPITQELEAVFCLQVVYLCVGFSERQRFYFCLVFNELFHYHLLDVAVISHKGPPLSRWSKGSNTVMLPCLSQLEILAFVNLRKDALRKSTEPVNSSEIQGRGVGEKAWVFLLVSKKKYFYFRNPFL